MKRAIRREVWETNSSTSHSVIIMTADQAKRWSEEELYYYNNRNWYDPFNKLPEEKKPKAGGFYTQDEVIKMYDLQGYHFDPDNLDYDKDEDDTEEILKDKFIEEMGDFISYDQWYGDECLEHDTEYYTSPSGDDLVISCRYGWDF